MSLLLSIKNFEKASDGISVRGKTIDLLSELLNDSEFVANDFFRYTAGEFVTKEQLSIEYSNFTDSLEYILIDNTNRTIYDRLLKISETKDKIRNAINALYKRDIVPTIGEYSYFEKYSEIIQDIPEFLDVRTTETTTIEENGEFESDEGEAFSSVVVNVPEKTLTTRVIKENGTYYAQQDGADGYEWVQVGVTNNVPKFNVRFWNQDRTQILYTAMDIPYGGYAVFGGEYPKSANEDEYFTAWNPTPTNITSDTDCYPMFSELATSHYEILDSWDTIVQNKGSGYPLGCYKALSIAGSEPSLDSLKPRAVKVAVGEGGSMSTWLVFCPYGLIPGTISVDSVKETFSIKDGVFSWRDSKARATLNSSSFLNALPSVIANAIVSVPKYSVGVDTSNATSASAAENTSEFVESIETRDKIWVPSIRELLGSTSRKINGTVDASPYSQYYMQFRKMIDNNKNGLSYDGILFSKTNQNDLGVYAFDYPELLHMYNDDSAVIFARDAATSVNGICSVFLSFVKYSADGAVYYCPNYVSFSTSSYYCPINQPGSGNNYNIIFGFCL